MTAITHPTSVPTRVRQASLAALFTAAIALATTVLGQAAIAKADQDGYTQCLNGIPPPLGGPPPGTRATMETCCVDNGGTYDPNAIDANDHWGPRCDFYSVPAPNPNGQGQGQAGYDNCLKAYDVPPWTIGDDQGDWRQCCANARGTFQQGGYGPPECADIPAPAPLQLNPNQPRPTRETVQPGPVPPPVQPVG
jgi:hypothetical protein